MVENLTRVLNVNIKRWNVTVTYTNGIEPNNFMIEELEELQEIIEVGPNFDYIKEIKIVYNF